ncbi:MAG: TSUP family transporter, partial [Bacteroidota bacterium]
MFDLDFTTYQWITLTGVAFLAGLGKAGLKGMSMIIVVLMANAFPVKASVGLVVLMFCTGDLLAINYYRRDASWTHIWRLLPAAVLGIGLGVWLDKTERAPR